MPLWTGISAEGADRRSTTCMSAATPNKSAGGKTPCYTTIQAAVDAASAGSILFIAGGNYSETVSVKGSKQLTFSGNWDQTFENQNNNTALNQAPGVEVGSSLTLQELNITP